MRQRVTASDPKQTFRRALLMAGLLAKPDADKLGAL